MEKINGKIKLIGPANSFVKIAIFLLTVTFGSRKEKRHEPEKCKRTIAVVDYILYFAFVGTELVRNTC